MVESDAVIKLLVVDDDPAVRHTIAGYLEEKGYIVTQASDGREGGLSRGGNPRDGAGGLFG